MDVVTKVRTVIGVAPMWSIFKTILIKKTIDYEIPTLQRFASSGFVRDSGNFCDF